MTVKEAIEVLKNAKYIGSDEYASEYDKRMNEAIDTVVAELKKHLPTDDCTHPFNEVERWEEGFEELYEAVKVQLEIIKNLIASKRVVNLDEAIAYYENLLKKHEHHVC